MTFTLRRLAELLGQPMPQSPTVPTLVADAEAALNWRSGALFNDNLQTGILAANTIGVTLTIPEDGFYWIDAAGVASDVQAAGPAVYRWRLEILDVDAATVIWGLSWALGHRTTTAVGEEIFMTSGQYQARLFLRKGMVVRTKLLDATTSVSGVFATSLALREMYQD